MQQEHEVELRAQNENLQTKVRTIEHERTRRDDAIFQLQRELQAKDLDIKNLGLIEMSLKQELSQLSQQRLGLEDQIQSSQQAVCQL